MSELFMDLIRDGGGCSIDCVCGRMNFGMGRGYDWDDGELENLREMAVKEPARYCEHTDCDGVCYGRIDGAIIVHGCPCNTGAKYEAFIWENRQVIMQYLAGRTASVLAEAKGERRLAKKMERGLTKLEAAEMEIARLRSVCKLNGFVDVGEDVPF